MHMRNLSWEEIEQLAKELAAKVTASGFAPDYLFGIAVGGLVPLGLMARELHTQRVATVSAHAYDIKTKERGELVISHLPALDVQGASVLLIDEIADSGTTLAHIALALREKCNTGEIKTATLV